MADPTTSAGEAPMYVPPNSAPVLQSLIAESAKLGHWALHEQLCGVLASVDAERRRHAEEVAALRAQFRRLEGLIGSDAVRRINDLEIQLCTVRDQLDDAHIELAARRALDADVRACAERCRDTLIGPPGMPVEDYPLAPEALAARRILAADFLREGGE